MKKNFDIKTLTQHREYLENFENELKSHLQKNPTDVYQFNPEIFNPNGIYEFLYPKFEKSGEDVPSTKTNDENTKPNLTTKTENGKASDTFEPDLTLNSVGSSSPVLSTTVTQPPTKEKSESKEKVSKTPISVRFGRIFLIAVIGFASFCYFKNKFRWYK